MKSMLFIIATFLSFASAAQFNWSLSNNGIPSDFFVSEFIGDGDSVIYAIGYSNVNTTPGIYRSSDNGSNWQATAFNGIPGFYTKFITGNKCGTTFLISATNDTIHAIYRSIDMVNWTLSSAGLTSDFVTIDICPLSASDIIISGETSSPDLYRSQDNGNSWQLVTTFGLPSSQYYTSLAYTGTYLFLNIGNTTNNTLYRSTDGISWSISNNGIPAAHNTFDYLSIDSTTLFSVGAILVPFNAAIYGSNDEGQSWQQYSVNGLENYPLAWNASLTFGEFMFIHVQSFSGNAVFRTDNLASVTNEQNATETKLVKIVDLLGRETEFQPNVPLIYIYEDGSTEKKMVIIE